MIVFLESLMPQKITFDFVIHQKVSLGILVGIRIEYYDVGSFHQGDFMLQVNLWDKINKIK